MISISRASLENQILIEIVHRIPLIPCRESVLLYLECINMGFPPPERLIEQVKMLPIRQEKYAKYIPILDEGTELGLYVLNKKLLPHLFDDNIILKLQNRFTTDWFRKMGYAKRGYWKPKRLEKYCHPDLLYSPSIDVIKNDNSCKVYGCNKVGIIAFESNGPLYCYGCYNIINKGKKMNNSDLTNNSPKQ